MDNNTATSIGYSLLMTYSTALANARNELAYWSKIQQEQVQSQPEDDITKKEIEKWVSEIEKYEKLIEEFLNKTPIGREDWFTEFTKWVTKAFDIFWYIFKKIENV